MSVRHVYHCVMCGKAFEAIHRRKDPRCSPVCAQKVVKICQQCGTHYIAGDKHGKYCSRSCEDDAKRIVYVCEVCGDTWTVKTRLHASRYSKCSKCYKKEMAARRTRRDNERIKWHPFTCADCGMVLYSKWKRKRCSVCAEKRASLKWKQNRPRWFKCRQCGVITENKKYSMRVCSSCVSKNKKEAARKHKQVRRARLRGVHAVNVSPQDIFKRDGYICQACGVKTRPSWNYNHDLYPSLDHIVPLSKGGAHDWHNLQCLCRRCNSIKGDGALNDQLLLALGPTG